MVIAGEFVGGAALGAAFGLLFDVVKETLDKSSAFKTLLKNLKFTLEFLKPVIDKIIEHNLELGLPDEEVKGIILEMEEGKRLVLKSSKISRWNCMRSYYTDQLIELEVSLKRLIEILKVQGVRDAKETLILARNIHEKITDTTNEVNETLVLAKGTLSLAQSNSDQIIESSNDLKETLDLAKQNADQLKKSARDGEETLVLARNIKRLLKQIQRLVSCSTHKGKSKHYNGKKGSKASIRGGRRSSRASKESHLMVYTYSEIRTATGNFSSDLWLSKNGGFGTIYKGWLDEKTLAPSKRIGIGMAVAVHQIYPTSMQGLEYWKREAEFIRKLSHPNLVQLFGYSIGGEHMFFVYEFMPNGSLQDHLFGKHVNEEPLSWINRLKIAIGAARGLDYLHNFETGILHMHLKPSNILLDGSYNSKLSDFYLAKWGPDGNDLYEAAHVCGTLGYTAPEFLITGILSSKNDVYGFGVVLFQILTGLKVCDYSRPQEEIHLVQLVMPMLQSDEENLRKIMDVRIEGQYSSQEALQTARLALRCLQLDPQDRPSMREVVQEMEIILAIREELKAESNPILSSSSL